MTRSQIDDCTAFVARYGARGLAYLKVNERARGREGLQSPIIKFLSDAALAGILERTGAADSDLIFFGADTAKVVNDSLGALRVKIGQDLKLVQPGWRPLWVVDFPMFEWDTDEKRWVAMHHPFTAPRNDDPAALRAQPGEALARAYDLVLNGSGVGGGPGGHPPPRCAATARRCNAWCSSCSGSPPRRRTRNSASCSMPSSSARHRTAVSPSG